MKPKLIIFASGSKDGGGSGFENLVLHSRVGELDADIVAVVSNHENGGVRKRADTLGIPSIYFPGPYDAENYSSILQKTAIAKDEIWVALSGWLKMVHGLDPAKTFNIHPAPLSFFGRRFGGDKMYGHNLHVAIADALAKGEISESGVSMHFVTEKYDEGPVFFEYRVPLQMGMSADDIQKLVNAAEHKWQPLYERIECGVSSTGS